MTPRRAALLAVITICVAACAPSGTPGPAATSRAAGTPTAAPSPTPTPAPKLTLGGLFHPTAPAPTDPARTWTLLATGDTIPARLVNIQATQRGDFLWPFRPTADYVKNADVTFINLETPLLAGCPARTTGLVFCGDPRFVDGLTAIGTKVANLANNHVYAGPDTQRTADLLQQHGIPSVSNLGPPVILNVKGLKVAFVGCNAVTGGPPVDRAALQANIQNARQQADVVIVQFHWGKEYERQPLVAPGIAPDDPIELGHLAVDSGADLVIGNHPHWVQGVEVYKNHLITYAHGNYVFDQVNCYPSIGADYRTYCSDDTRTSVVGTYTFDGAHLAGVTWKPTYADTNLQTQWADPTRAAQVLQTMEDASVTLAQKEGEPTS
ncbi:MAG: CapA family protein [Chloroflexi bacterium]|nr:MAG: CapA family protein [Chloroflexota bacterium]